MIVDLSQELVYLITHRESRRVYCIFQGGFSRLQKGGCEIIQKEVSGSSQQS